MYEKVTKWKYSSKELKHSSWVNSSYKQPLSNMDISVEILSHNSLSFLY